MFNPARTEFHMGRQVNFIADAADWNQLLEFASVSKLMAVPELIAPKCMPKLARPTEFMLSLAAGEYSFYLLPPECTVSQLAYQPIPTDRRFSKLCARYSPVIELSPPEKHSEQIAPGRIYVNTEQTSPGYDAAIRAYNRLARFVRGWKQKTDRFNVYVGPSAANAWRAGRLNVSPAYCLR